MMDGQLVTLAYGYIDGRSIDEQMDRRIHELGRYIDNERITSYIDG